MRYCILGCVTVRRLIVILALVTLLGACGEAADDSPETGKTEDNQAAIQRSPITGLEMKDGLPKHPAYLVKLENTDNGAPQYGLDKADLVVEQLVEGGLTRLAAMYYSKLPTKLGHVRSMRGTDIGIAAPVAARIVASGAAPHVYSQVKKADAKALTQDDGAAGFSTDPAKTAPYNQMLNLKKLNSEAADGSVSDNYLPWGSQSDETAGETATKAQVRFSPKTQTNWVYKKDTWRRTNGHAASGQKFKADTLIIVHAPVVDAGYTDPAGNPVPETQFSGSGKATILQGDTVIKSTWKKNKASSAVSFTDADGKELSIKPGRVWIELVPNDDGKVTVN